MFKRSRTSKCSTRILQTLCVSQPAETLLFFQCGLPSIIIIIDARAASLGAHQTSVLTQRVFKLKHARANAKSPLTKNGFTLFDTCIDQRSASFRRHLQLSTLRQAVCLARHGVYCLATFYLLATFNAPVACKPTAVLKIGGYVHD